MTSHRPRGIALAALSGVASMSAGVAVAQLVAVIVAPASSPVVAVGGAFIDATPTWLKEFAIERFGTADKAVLLTGIGLVLVVAAGAAGILARRRPSVGAAVLAGIGLVGVAAAATRPATGPAQTLPALAGAVVAPAVLLLLLRRPRRAADAVLAASPTGPSRRSLLVGSLAVTAGAVVVGSVANVLGSRLRDLETTRAAIRLPAPAEPAAPLSAAVDVRVDGVTPFRVPNADFYRVDTALVVPSVDVSTWRLDIGGMVAEPYRIDYDELLAMPMIERDLTLTCVSNEVGGPYVGNAVWLGVRLTDLLERARVDRGADQLFSTSVDGFTASTPLAALDGRDAIVAVAMNGEPLPAEHGFPARMVIPGLYGFVSATKWLVSLEATTYADRTAYWTERGWATDAPVRTMARIEVPRPLSTVEAGMTAVAGTAWAQHRGIDRVEVQIDDQPWTAARLGAVPSVDTWRQWWLPWYADPGRHTIRVRATDESGQTQPADRLAPFPSGAQGWHEVVVIVR
jgi:DMSO/TMAO reductase YedYZ molybdopterin-dependent catalytic subunit